MVRGALWLLALPLVLVGFFTMLPTMLAQASLSPLEKYRNLEFPPKDENFDKGWKERVAVEFEIINSADLKSLRTALKDENPFVRSIAARALGILGDKASADALAEVVKNDKEYMVRLRAVESLGLLRMKADVIEQAKKDKDGGVSWVAKLAADQVKSDVDYAAELLKAYRAGIKLEEMDTAKVGRPAPDFSARTTDGKPFKLSSVLGKKPIAIYFAAFDG